MTVESGVAEAVYRPQADTRLLINALSRQLAADRDVADLCTGSGAIAIHAALLGARSVTAVDTSAAAIASVRASTSRRGLDGHVTAVHADVASFDWPEAFDLITCNPPYVPTPNDTNPLLHPPGPSHCWDAGPHGRTVLDVVCSAAPRLLRPGGSLLLVQSEFADIPTTLATLGRAGLSARVVVRAQIPFGPVLSARAAWLESERLLDVGRRRELLAVICAERPR